MPAHPALSNIDIPLLCRLQERPAPFAPGESQFWTDAHIARQLLAVHLDPHTDLASRRPETIERSTAWIVETLGMKPGDCVLDLGCGPGLYAARLAQLGFQVTGVDFSQNSLDYAQTYAHQHGLAIDYRCQNYLEFDDRSLYEVVLLIYGDLCPLSPAQRTRLFANVGRALKPGGRFVFDVSTPYLRQKYGLKKDWYAARSGLWKPGPHLVLEQGFAYPDDIFLDQYIVIEADCKISTYRNWFQDYTPETITAELQANGFTIESMWSDLSGTPYEPASDWLGIVSCPTRE